MHLLALDIGTRRTGAAYGDTTHDFVMALDTISHTTDDELVRVVASIIASKKIDEVVIGLPKLLGGEEGSQAEKVHRVAEMLIQYANVPVSYLDERFSSLSTEKSDPDARAALEMAKIALARRRNGIDI